MIHTLTIKDENLHGSFSNEYKPIPMGLLKLKGRRKNHI